MGSLPPALALRNHRVMVVTPRHSNGGKDLGRYSDASPVTTVTGDGVIRVTLGGGTHELKCYHLRADGVDWVFVDHSVFQRPGTPYGALIMGLNAVAGLLWVLKQPPLPSVSCRPHS